MTHKIIYISISEFPGKIGWTMHNAAYKELGLNCMYIPLKVNSENLENIIQIIKQLHLY